MVSVADPLMLMGPALKALRLALMLTFELMLGAFSLMNSSVPAVTPGPPAPVNALPSNAGKFPLPSS